MAPEQVERSWRAYGPWTDLYALGCVAYELVCGEVPFGDSSSAMGALLRHLSKDRPELKPQMAVPEGLEGWVRRAMALDRRERFQCAAEAARGLHELGEPAVSAGCLDAGEPEALWEAKTEILTLVLPEERRLHQRAPEGPIPARSRTPAPPTWRAAEEAEPPAPLPGTGRGLFGLREIPFVGREAQRDRLWEELRQVLATGRSRIVVVEGEAGTGKSRLVEWIATRSRELGLVELLKMRHSPGGGRVDEGGAGMLQQELRMAGLTRQEVVARFRERGADEIDARALTEIALPSREGEEGGYRFSVAGEARVILRHWLEHEARRAPRLLWIDDAQWSIDACHFVRELAEREVPLLVILVVRSEELSDEAASILEALPRIAVRPLSEGEHRRVIDRMLPLRDDVARGLAARTEGNPLFAMQILADWLEAEALDSLPEGFAPLAGRAGLPDSLHELWQRRLEREVRRLRPASRARALEALGTAALMGREIDEGEWEAVLQLVGGAQDLVEVLAEQGLVRWRDGGWRFAHGLFRESLERLGREKGLLPAWHRQAAQALAVAWAEKPMEASLRRARHLAAAGQMNEACEAYLLAQDRERVRGGQWTRVELLAEWLRWLDARADDEDEEARGSWRRLARLHHIGTLAQLFILDVDEAHEECEVLAAEALVRQEWLAYGLATRVLIEFLVGAGDYQGVVEVGSRALAELPPDELVRNRILISVAWAVYRQGSSQEALRLLAEAISRAEQAGNVVSVLEARLPRAMLLQEIGVSEDAARENKEILRQARAHGLTHITTRCLVLLGEFAREQGDLEAARGYYQETIEYARRREMLQHAMFARFNLLLVLVAEGQFGALRGGLADWERDFGASQQAGQFQMYKQYLELVIAIAEGASDEVGRRLEELEEACRRDDYFDPDFCFLSEAGANLLRGGWAPEAAALAARVEALGREVR